MFGKIVKNSEKPLLPGYKLKYGEYTPAATSLNIPDNIIPLTLSCTGLGGSALNSTITTIDDKGKQIILFYWRGYNGQLAWAQISKFDINLLPMYENDYELLKQIKSFSGQINFTLTRWLEKK